MKLDLDLHIPNDDFALKFYQGSNHKLVLNLYRDGVADTNISGYTATIHVYDSINDTSTYQIDSTSTDASAGTMTFEIAPGDLPPKRVYQGSEIIIKDGSDNPYFYADGTVTVRASILGSVASALSAGLGITWSLFSSYVGTATSGPYRAGTNVTFSGNSDGSVDINASGGGGGGASPYGAWKYATGGGVPSAKHFTTNNADAELVTSISISDENDDGVDMSQLLSLIGVGDLFYIQEESDSTKAHLYEVTAATDNTTYWTFTVTHEDPGSGGTWSNNQRCSIYRIAAASTGDVTSSAAIADNALVKGDGGAKGVQASGITCDNSNNLTGVAGISASGTIDAGAIDMGNMYIDDGSICCSDLMINPAGTKRFYIYDTAVIHNPLSTDWDFILKGDNEENVLYMDASADKVGILNSTPSEALDVTGNIGVSGTVDGRDVATDGSKLDGIATGATANQTDAYLLSRANHTGTQTASTISDFDTEVSNNTDVTANTAKLTANEANVTSALDGATITSATVATGDKVLIQDVDDSDNLKTVTAQSIADLASGGGALPAYFKDWEGSRFSANGGPLGTGASPAPHAESGTNLNIYGAAFDDSQTETAGPFRLRVPDSVDNTVDVDFHLRGFGGDTNNAKFRVQYATNGDNSLTNADSTFAVSTSKTAIAENTISVDMTLTAGDELIFYLARLGADAADTSTGDFVITLLTVEIGRA